MKKTIAQKLIERKAKRPNPVLYGLLQIVIKIISHGVKPKFIYNARPSEDKGPFVLISNHASRVDYLYTAPVCYPRRLNYVVGYNEFFVRPTAWMLNAVHVIPKKNFVTDVHCLRQIMTIIKKGGCICFMPEGMSSITGMAQPVMVGGGALLKKLGVNVYYTKIRGGYLANTKHYIKQRNGQTEVTVDIMFTPEDLARMTPEQIEDRMNELLAHDDYIWNKEKQIAFKDRGEGMAAELDTLLYMCPKCGAMHQMECIGDTMKCKACENTITIDNKYNIAAADEKSVCPELVTDWALMERQTAAEDVRKEGFKFSEHVTIGMLPKFKLLKLNQTSEICGDGELALSTAGLDFNGTAYGEPLNFHIPIQSLPTCGMCTDISHFSVYDKGRFIEFFPEHRNTLRWDHLVEEMHRAMGGKWQNTPYRHRP